MNTQDKIKVMQAYLDGAQIEILASTGAWNPMNNGEPKWNWGINNYRVAPLTKPSIDWSQVNAKYQFLALNRFGVARLYPKRPTLNISCGEYTSVDYDWTEATPIASFKPGDCEWQDSLVERPSVFRISDDFNRTFVTRKGERVRVSRHASRSDPNYVATGNGWYYRDDGRLFSSHEHGDDIVAAL